MCSESNRPRLVKCLLYMLATVLHMKTGLHVFFTCQKMSNCLFFTCLCKHGFFLCVAQLAVSYKASEECHYQNIFHIAYIYWLRNTSNLDKIHIMTLCVITNLFPRIHWNPKALSQSLIPEGVGFQRLVAPLLHVGWKNGI